MALSNVVNANGVNGTQATAPQASAPQASASAPSVGGAGNKALDAKASAQERHSKFLASGRAIREKMSAEELQLEGSKSDKVKFVAALGNPNKPQFRKENNQDIPSYEVVGFAFKALEDMEVPRADLKSGFKNFMDVNPISMVQVKAGETFYLNIFETGALMAQEAYAGTFSGEGEVVRFNVKFAQNREDPLIVLNKDGKGSVKENMILVADMVGTENGAKGTPQVKPEFADKFAVLYERKVAGKKSSSSANKIAGESTKSLAAAFRAYVKSKQ